MSDGMTEVEVKRGVFRHIASKGNRHCSCSKELIKWMPSEFRQDGNRILREMVDLGILLMTWDRKRYCIDWTNVKKLSSTDPYVQYIVRSNDISKIVYYIYGYEKQVYSISLLQEYVYCW